MTQEPIAYINVEKRTLEFAEPIKWHTPTVANLDRIPLFTKEALAQTQEPVAWQFMNGSNFRKRRPDDFADLDSDGLLYWKPLYTTPPQRTWVGLEGEEIRNLWEEATKPDRSTMTMVTSFAKSIEAKLKQKNGYAEENT
jgi:hypothetical protein